MSAASSPDLIVVGAGAAGLFAAGLAARAGLRTVLVERRHRPGQKLLMCGNNRCNFSHEGTPAELLRAYGQPVAPFLRAAIAALPPEALRREFAAMGLESVVSGGRLYPASGKADDVLHALMDRLRDCEVPLITNCPVESIRRQDGGGWIIQSRCLTLEAPAALLCIGGFSYPKTGSAGDGERFSRQLGLKFEPARAGLVAQELPRDCALAGLSCQMPVELPDVALSYDGLPPCRGNLVIDRGLMRGSAIYDLNRLAARGNLPGRGTIAIDLFPQSDAPSLERRIRQLQARIDSPARLLNALGMPGAFAQWLATALRRLDAEALKRLAIGGTRPRAIKEAIVTVGGLAREEFSPDTMECRRLPGLYAAGEVLDIDGPTGGYNLHAAFATAFLAAKALSGKIRPATAAPATDTTAPERSRPAMRNSAKCGKNAKSAWGEHFWEGRKGRRP